MKIVNMIGGLGNQMFQFALYMALRRRYPAEEVKISTGAFRGYPKHNAYELDRVFGLVADVASMGDMARIAYPYCHYRLWQMGYHWMPQRHTMLNERIFGHYYAEALEREGDCYYDGYWQNERYFANMRQEVLMAYTPIDVDEHNLTIGRRLASSQSVSIHVRHGDFLDVPLYRGICGLDYYKRAITEMRHHTQVDTFCIVSNDTAWCHEHILPLLGNAKCIVPDWNCGERSYLDMYLMSQCRHNIIAHSSFSWWGAWLNQHPDKVVIGPQKWNNLKVSEFELNPDWIKI